MIGITPNAIANEIRMMRPQFNGTFLIVESHDDRRFYSRFTNAENCKFRAVDGRPTVEKILGILDADNFEGAVGIVDADYSRIVGERPTSKNCFFGDCHDLETMLMRSSALDVILLELGNETKLSTLDLPPRDFLLRSARPIWALRLYSHANRVGLKFSGMRYQRFIDRDDLSVDIDKLAKEVHSRSRLAEITIGDLLDAIEDYGNRDVDTWDVACGDDLLALLSIGLQKRIGTNSSGECNIDRLKYSLRLAYQEREFTETNLKRELQAWVSRNPNYTFI